MSHTDPHGRRARLKTFLVLCTGVLMVSGGCDRDPTRTRDVASISLAAPSHSVEAGKTLQLTATAFDSRGREVRGTTFTWTSSDSTIARVDQTGMVTGRAGGKATITAGSGGAAGTIEVTVTLPPAARLALVPSVVAVEAGGTASLRAVVLAANGDTLRGASVTWGSTAESTARVDASGKVTGVAEGIALIGARVDGASDTAFAAVLPANGVLATALPGGAFRAEAKAGEEVSVPVVLDLSRAGSDGDLGAVQLDVVFDPAVLAFEAATSGLTGGASDANLVAPGRVRFAYAGAAPQGSGVLTLVTLRFRVAAGAVPGAQSGLSLEFAGAPVSTGFAAYAQPVVAGGRVRVAAP